MPVYEYLCEGCGERFEVMQKFADAPVATHSKCGGPVHRLLSVPALQFKGSGWYVTDYAKNTKPEGDGGPKKAEPAATAPSTETPSTGSSTPSSPEKTKTSASTETKAPATKSE